MLLISTGGLGAPVMLYLAAAGVGKLGIVDFGFADISNLQRQITYSTKDINRPEVASAKDKIKTIDPKTQVGAYNIILSSKNTFEIIREYGLVVDGTDNYPIRYLTSDACVLLGKLLVYGSIFQFEGQVSIFYTGQGPCYRCLYPEPPPPGLVPSCVEGGVAGVLPGIIGTIQATEAIKLIVGGSKSLIGRLLLFDVWRAKRRELRLERNPGCSICGKHPLIHAFIDCEEFCGLKSDEPETPIEGVTTLELHMWTEEGEPPQLIDIREPHGRMIAKFPQVKVMSLGQIVRCIDRFSLTIDAVFLCKMGQCSIFAIRALQRAGYQGRVMNLKDGLNAWARDVGTHLPQY